MKTTLSAETLKTLTAPLKKANEKTAALFPGDSAERQPVHTVYGGAHLFKADTAGKLGQLALRALEQNAPDAEIFGVALDLPKPLRATVYSRVVEKLKREPVEDFRIDFEDGYGNRPDEEEDGHAVAIGQELARGLEAKTLPPFIGIRIKTLSRELHLRSLRTLDLFLSSAAGAAKRLPKPFYVTVPKITSAEQVAVVAKALDQLEAKLKLPKKSVSIELMVETTQSIIGPDGRSPMRDFVAAAGGRCTGAHFGTYDYTAGCNVTAAHQHMMHPACDFAKNVMQVTLAGTGVNLSDGATNVMPVGKTREEVWKAWRLHFSHVRHSLETAYYQGWDLHPAQLPTRYAAVYSFFLEGLEPASQRLSNFVNKAAQATLVGDVFDDAATGQGLLNYFLRGMSCGAITEAEAEATGLSREDFEGRSFLKILESRRKGAARTAVAA